MSGVSSDYRRGWENALEVVLDLRDWEEIEDIERRLTENRVKKLRRGPL